MKPPADSVTRSRELATGGVSSGHCAKKDAILKPPMSADPATEPLADDFLMEVPRQLWTYRQVADWMQVSVRTVERMVAEGRLQLEPDEQATGSRWYRPLLRAASICMDLEPDR